MFDMWRVLLYVSLIGLYVLFCLVPGERSATCLGHFSGTLYLYSLFGRSCQCITRIEWKLKPQH